EVVAGGKFQRRAGGLKVSRGIGEGALRGSAGDRLGRRPAGDQLRQTIALNFHDIKEADARVKALRVILFQLAQLVELRASQRRIGNHLGVALLYVTEILLDVRRVDIKVDRDDRRREKQDRHRDQQTDQRAERA